MAGNSYEASVYSRQGKAWSAEEERQLYDDFVGGQPVPALASKHKRSPGGIRSRLARLGLVDDNGETVQPTPPFTPIQRRESTAPTRAPSARKEDAVPSIFSATTNDGWVVDIRSNRPLTRPLIDRLASMLHGVFMEDQTQDPTE